MADLHKFIIILCLLLLSNIGSSALGQKSNLIQLYLPPSDRINLGDSTWIDPSSFRLLSHSLYNEIPKEFYSLYRSTLILDTSKIKDSIIAIFRVFPYSVHQNLFIYDSIEHHYPVPPEYSLLNKKSAQKDWWEKSGLEYSGNYTRGLSVGNNQSLIVNSALNLQLIGDLGDGIKITGAITDNQIPIQPEGNTRQIQEFDRLYLELKKNKTSLVVGDFDLQKPHGYFQNYFKKSLGAQVQNAHTFKNIQLTHSGSLGISKGKFNRLTIPIVNANQGPYRLRGRDGENFIIVLAASEKVFLDGKLLTRGDDADYIMDYNLGELRFTPRRLVTDQMRLIIEFEYTDQNYLRSLITYKFNAQKNNWNSYINYYRENDSRKPSVSNDLDSLEQIILSQSGDHQESATSSRVSRAGSSFRPDRVYYIAKDTSFIFQGNSIQKQIFKYNENSDSNSLQIIFTEIGLNKGEYQLIQSNVNGRVYQWVGSDPITGIPLGSYAPYRVLVAPRNHQMGSFGIRYQSVDKRKLSIWMESTLSYLDKNRLSHIQDKDNLGFAGIINFSAPTIVWKKIEWKNSLNYEYNDERFFALNPYRNPEFIRDWNINSQTGFNDQILTYRSQVLIGNKINTETRYDRFDRQNEYLGNKYLLLLSRKDSVSELNTKLDYLKSEDRLQGMNFIRSGISYNRNFYKLLTLGIAYEREHNARRLLLTDSLSRSSFDFQVVSSFIKLQKSENKSIQFDWKRRTDDLPQDSIFNDFSTSDEFGLIGILNNSKSGNWKAQFTARNIAYNNNQLQDSIGQYYFLGQLDHSVNFLKNAIRIKNIYSLQSGAEPRVEFVYEERRPGDGDYIYIDFNKDGIRQSGEYVFAPEIDTARFVKIQLFNSEYFQTYQSSIHSVFGIDCGRLFKTSTKNILSKVSYESLLRFSNKITPNSSALERINPFLQQKNNSAIISFQKNINQQLFFNRADPKYELSLQYSSNGNQILLISGLESRIKQEINFRSRWTALRRLDWLLNSALQEDQRKTEFYELQNYNIKSQLIELSTVYRLNRDIRIQLGSKFKNSKETIFKIESTTNLEFFIQGQLSFNKKFSGRIDLRYINIQYTGTPGSAIEYVMLDGLKDGNNLTGEFVIDWRLSSVMFAQFSYSLRKPSGQDAINTGRASLRANF